MILDMSGVLAAFERLVTIKTIVRSTTDFVESVTVEGRQQKCVVQVADKSKINPATIDWNLEYLLVHTAGSLEMGELIEFNSRDYKVVQIGDWNGYGYIEVVAEETKRPLVS
jgi:hypothetical protein